MIQFNRIGTSALYLSDANQASGGWGFAITRTLPEGQQFPPSASLKDALTNLTWQGSFVYVATGPYPGSDGDPATFIDHLRSFIADASVSGQGAIIFLPDGSADQLDVNTLQTYTLLNRTSPTRITPSGPGLSVALTAVDGLRMLIKPNAQLSVPDDGDRIDLDLTNSPVATLGGTFAPSVKAPVSNGAQLHFSGTASGAFTFPLTIVQSTLYTQTNWGFQFLIPSQSTVAGVGATPVKYLAAWLPFADPGPPNAVLGFIAQVNEVNPRNQIADASRTLFAFDGTGTDTALASYYRTSVGKPITLTPVPTGNDPAGLIINDGYGTTPIQNGLRLAPVGDFVLAVDGAAPGQPQSVLCGTSGTETIDFLPEIAGTQSGSRLRFVANQPADIPQFPVQAASPVGPPVEAGVQLFGNRFQTSWVALVPPPSDPGRLGHYSAAPEGAELFGETPKGTGLLEPKDPGLGLPGTTTFPMMPLAGFTAGQGDQDVTADQLVQVSREIVSPTRRAAIAAGEVTHASSAAVSLFADAARVAAASAGLIATTTPTGFITRYGENDGLWKQLLLAQVETNGTVTRQLGFTGLNQKLQSAFQTSEQFLVIANHAELGPFVPGRTRIPRHRGGSCRRPIRPRSPPPGSSTPSRSAIGTSPASPASAARMATTAAS